MKQYLELLEKAVTNDMDKTLEPVCVAAYKLEPLPETEVIGIAMETNHISNLKYVYVTEDGTEHISHYVENRCEGEHYPNSEYMDLKNRYFCAFYKRLRKE